VIPARTHIWGLDLSNTVQEAGGVGGLLSVKEGETAKYYTFDGNGNVSELLEATGNVQAHYEYDPFGNTDSTTGAWANTNAWRFSSKPVDAASGLYYYGYRFYNPVSGRWINRDIIEEWGCLNLYNQCGNDTMNSIDILGLFEIRRRPLNSFFAKNGANAFYGKGDARGQHWHIFYDDGSNSGYLGNDKKTGFPIFSSDKPSLLPTYVPMSINNHGLSDPVLRIVDDNMLKAAEAAVQARWNAAKTPYSHPTHDCQSYVIEVLHEYRKCKKSCLTP
jgi:RHS repeat-associated protein